MDYGKFRNRMKAAHSLAPKIAEAATALAKLLEQAGEVGGGRAPSEFYSIQALLDATDNHELDGHNFSIWRMVRGAITGSTRECKKAGETTDSEASAKQVVPEIVIQWVSPGDAAVQNSEEMAQNHLFYAWEKAPSLPALLETVAHAAESWVPQECGAISAAISNRQRNRGSEYVRAFAMLLRQNMPSLEFSASIYAAIAGIADVVLNDANNVVTADAVRKALSRVVDNSA